MLWNRVRIPLSIGVILVLGVFILAFSRNEWLQEKKTQFFSSKGKVYLSELSWASANVGWYGVGKEGLPAKDTTFIGTSMAMGGVVYGRGVGTYVPSEMSYRLDGRFSFFEATVGLDDEQPRVSGKAKFLVLIDGVQVYDSGPMGRGDPPKKLRIPVAGAKELRLVTVEEGSNSSYANWADARLVSEPLSPEDTEVLKRVETENRVRTRARVDHNRELEAMAKREVESLKALLHQTGQGSDGRVAALEDPSRNRLILANSSLAVSLGFGGANHGYITLLDLVSQKLVIYDTTSSVSTNGGKTYAFHGDTEPLSTRSFRFEEIDDPVLGGGKALSAQLRSKDRELGVLVEIALYQGSPYLLYQISLLAAPQGAYPVVFRYFDITSGSQISLGEGINYLTDFSRLKRAMVPDDGVIKREKVGLGKPVLVWSRKENRGLLLAALDEVRLPHQFSVKLAPGRGAFQMGFRASSRPALESLEDKGAHDRGNNFSSPRFYIEIVDTSNLQKAFANYRKLITSLYPPAPMPSWVRYQWLSWYTYYMDINEVYIKEQIDYIADNLVDLGPWHILVDAGWYVAEGQEGAEWRNVDSRKFPSGLKALVDYAHFRGVKVVLYFSAPYLDAREREGDWLGLKGILDEHPDWLLSLDEEEPYENFVYDFSNPELREYLREVMKDFFVRYNVDGIKIDGLGGGEGVFLDPEDGAQFGLSDKSIAQVMDIYRFIHQVATEFKEDIYVESGWMTPITANPYAHTFRYGDEEPLFSRPYPLPGLLEHIDYAAFQLMLGQRANMGAIYDHPENSPTNRWWLGAGLALGNQVVLSFDLAQLSPQALSVYRSLLAQYRPFEGETYLDGRLFPRAFATKVGETTFLGLLNRKSGPQEISVNLAQFGFGPGESYVAYDEEGGTFFSGYGTLRARVGGQSFRLFVLRSKPGVLWTNGSFQAEESQDLWRIKVKGPETIEGFMHLYAPNLRAFYIDGERVELESFSDFYGSTDGWAAKQDVTIALHRPNSRAEDGESLGYYDPYTQVLTLRYNYDREHVILIEKP